MSTKQNKTYLCTFIVTYRKLFVKRNFELFFIPTVQRYVKNKIVEKFIKNL